MRHTVGVVGLGYVGLPLAVAFAEAGSIVIGLDVDQSRVAAVNAGDSYIEDVPSVELAPLVGAGHLSATRDYEDLRSADAIVITVPTPLTDAGEPDLTCIVDAATSLARVLREGQLVVLESTTYPGTTRERLVPLLEESGLAAGQGFHVAFSPERIDPGRTDWTIRTTPKVVGGLTERCGEVAADLYGRICDEIVSVSTPDVAEMSKLLENVFRSVNVAFVNELAMLCDRMGIDVWEVIDAASSKPFGFMRFEPGPGLGGHCLPLDPSYLSARARNFDFQTEFIDLSGKVNMNMPYFCTQKILRAMNARGQTVNGSNVLLMGVAYKPGVSDLRESPALKIVALLRELGADVSYHDPHVPELPQMSLRSVPMPEALDSTDVAAVITAHPEVDYEEVLTRAPLVIDFRGVLRRVRGGNLVKL